MSGASALAAAKRRRAVPTEPVRPSNSQKNPMPEIRAPTVQQNQIQTPAQNPLYLLLQHEQKLKDLETTFSNLKMTENKSNTLTPDNLQFFKTQHELMNQELNELKKIIIKVQTFSMETNLELLKLKNQLKANEKHEHVNELNETTENIE